MPNDHQDRLERDALESLVAQELSAKMKQWRMDNQPPPPRNGKWLFLILFMLLVSGGVAWLFFPRSQPAPSPMPEPLPAPGAPPEKQPETSITPAAPAPNHTAIARQWYRMPDFSGQIRGSRSDVSALKLKEAQTALDAHQYEKAQVLLEQTPPEYESDAQYLRAHACFGLKQYRKAADIFQTLQKSVRYGEASEWYLQLALLAADSSATKKVQKQVQKIAGSETHTYQQEAIQLLQALK